MTGTFGRPLVGILIGALSCLTVAACSSEEDDDDSGSSINNNGNQTGAGGSSSITPPGEGGAAASLPVGGSGTGVGGSGSGVGGSGTTTTGGSSATTGGSSSTVSVRTGETCEGMPYDPTGEEGDDCVGNAVGVEPLPVDMYILMDRTSSMSEPLGAEGSMTRWEAISGAMEQFATDERAINSATRAGMAFFSYSASINEDVECNPANYATPVVDILPLEESGPLMSQEINDMTEWVGGLTPTYPALQGALQRAIDHQQASGGMRLTVVVLVTDGLPTQCSPQDMQSVAALANEAYANFGILTFAVGLGVGRWNLEQIARLGGTIEPTIIDEGDGVDQFLSTILSISSTPLSCELPIPDPPSIIEQIDYDKVRVIYTPPASTGEGPEEIPRLSSPSLCGESPYGGWYYDSATNPTKIRVCDCNCNRFGTGTLEAVFGCEPREFGID